MAVSDERATSVVCAGTPLMVSSTTTSPLSETAVRPRLPGPASRTPK